MNTLFVHNGFPGQYIHIVNSLACNKKNTVVGLGMSGSASDIIDSVKYYMYQPKVGNSTGLISLLQDIESKCIRGYYAAELAYSLRKKGFEPDIICGHTGWGELLFLGDIWPKTPILAYQEFNYNYENFDYNFDPEFRSEDCEWEARARIRMKTTNSLLSLQLSSWNITPTKFQLSSYPVEFHNKFSVLHDGVNTERTNGETARRYLKEKGIDICNSTKIVTFASRYLEPYRGFHIFMRSLKFLLQDPDILIIIVGTESGRGYGPLAKKGTWKELLSEEVKNVNLSKVHFTGLVSYPLFRSILSLSNCHVYLTYPFVLSWSLLDAMAEMAPIVASDTAPVREFIVNGYNGCLVDFFDAEKLAERVGYILKDSEVASVIAKNARSDVIKSYSTQICVPQHLSLIELVSKKTIGY